MPNKKFKSLPDHCLEIAWVFYTYKVVVLPCETTPCFYRVSKHFAITMSKLRSRIHTRHTKQSHKEVAHYCTVSLGHFLYLEMWHNIEMSQFFLLL